MTLQINELHFTPLKNKPCDRELCPKFGSTQALRAFIKRKMGVSVLTLFSRQNPTTRAARHAAHITPNIRLDHGEESEPRTLISRVSSSGTSDGQVVCPEK